MRQEEALDLLIALNSGLRERQARNVGRDQALGVKVGDTWVWSRAATLAHLEQRRSADPQA